MSESLQCMECGIDYKFRTNRIRKFCSKQCSNLFNGRLRNFENTNKQVCDTCNCIKVFSDFSMIDKYDKFSGRKSTCKKCSRNKKSVELRNRTWKEDAVTVMFNNSKARAKKSGLEFTITKQDIIIPEYCPVLGLKLDRTTIDDWTTSPSIDRIDNTKGYTKENIVVVSRRANILKKDATKEELKCLSDYYNSL